MSGSLDVIRRKRAEMEAAKRAQEQAPAPAGEKRTVVLTPEIVFYSVDDLVSMLGWSRHTVLRLFHSKDFPGTNLGKSWQVEAEALREYFSVRRTKEDIGGY